MTTYICKCGRRVQKSSNADNTGNRIENYRPGFECYGCPYAMPWGRDKWDEETKHFVQDVKGYECRMSKTLSYASQFIGSTKDKCTCSVVSLDFDFLEQISAWVKETFTLGELTGHFSRDEIRATDYSHDGRYNYGLCCAGNKKGIAAKAALFAQFFNQDGSRKDMTPQQEMEKVLTDIRKAKEATECATVPNADAAATAAESAAPNATAETPTTSENAEDASESAPAASPQTCESGPAASAEDSSAPLLSMTGCTLQEKPLTFIPESMAPKFDYSGLSDQTVADLHLAEKEYRSGKKMAARGYIRMGEAVGIAHDALVANCDKHNNQHSEDNFRKWCLSIGITKDTAYRLLQISSMFESSSPRQQDILQELPPSLLYAAAKPSAPQELVEKVKNGEVATNKAYQDLLKENQQLRTERDKARADQLSTAKDCNRLGLKVSQEKDRADKAEAREEEAWKLQSKAEARAQEAEKQLEGSRQVAEAAKLRADKLKAENDALKKQPITAVVDEEEVDRRAGEKAYEIAAGMTADYKVQQEQDARDAYDGILLAGRTMTNAWQAAKLLFAKLPTEQREPAANQLIRTLGQIQGEVSQCL